jgi:hypothetical protein
VAVGRKYLLLADDQRIIKAKGEKRGKRGHRELRLSGPVPEQFKRVGRRFSGNWGHIDFSFDIDLGPLMRRPVQVLRPIECQALGAKSRAAGPIPTR